MSKETLYLTYAMKNGKDILIVKYFDNRIPLAISIPGKIKEGKNQRTVPFLRPNTRVCLPWLAKVNILGCWGKRTQASKEFKDMLVQKELFVLYYQLRHKVYRELFRNLSNFINLKLESTKLEIINQIANSNSFLINELKKQTIDLKQHTSNKTKPFEEKLKQVSNQLLEIQLQLSLLSQVHPVVSVHGKLWTKSTE